MFKGGMSRRYLQVVDQFDLMIQYSLPSIVQSNMGLAINRARLMNNTIEIDFKTLKYNTDKGSGKNI